MSKYGATTWSTNSRTKMYATIARILPPKDARGVRKYITVAGSVKYKTISNIKLYVFSLMSLLQKLKLSKLQKILNKKN